MLVIVLLGDQPNILKKLIAIEIKEVYAWQAATGSTKRARELEELEDLMRAIPDSEEKG